MTTTNDSLNNPGAPPLDSASITLDLEGAEPELNTDVGAPGSLERLLAVRDALWASHPVVTWDERFALPTPTLDFVAKVVSSSIYSRRSGRGFCAPPRYGKSTAIRYLTESIRQAFPNVPVLVAEAAPSLRPSEGDFYGDLLDAAGYAMRPARVPRERRKQLVNLLWTLANTRGERRLVLFIDEAQEYGEYQWGWLKAVQNHLTRLGVSLIVFPFGQLELEHERSALSTVGRTDLVTRFMRSLVQFPGIKTDEDLEQVLAVFDELGRYPRKEGWTFSQFFFPKTFDAGWRLVNETSRAWQAITQLNLHRKPGGVGMEWIGAMIRHFLTEYVDEDRAGWKGTSKHWEEALAASDAADPEPADG